MYTKEQMEQWVAWGFPFSDQERAWAVSGRSPSIKIRYASEEADGNSIVIKFSVYSQELKGKQAFVSLVGSGKKSSMLIGSMSEKITNNTMDWYITVPFDSITVAEKFYLSVWSGSVSANSSRFDIYGFFGKNSQKAKCYCNRDITPEELEQLIVTVRKKDMSGIIRAKRDLTKRDKQKDGNFALDENGNKIYYELSAYEAPYGNSNKPLANRIFFLGDEKISEGEANFKIFAKELNKCFNDYKINNCLRKIHFLGQAYVETQMLTKSYETTPSPRVSGGEFYRGRGLVQLTNDYNYRAFYKVGANKEPSTEELNKFVPTIATSMKMACQGSAWYWSDVNANKYADEDNIDLVSAAVNRPAALRNPAEIYNINDIDGRRRYTGLFRKIMNYDECDNK